MKNPLITVYIPSRNYGRFLTKAIESVISQHYENWELFIYDEASSDETLLIAKNYEAKYPNKISVVSADKPQGLQKIANSVIAKANGKYLIRLDADDWLGDSAFLVMVSKLELNSKLGLVYPNYFYTNEAGDVIGMERRLKLWEEDKSGYFPPHGACTMVRLRSLKAVGGYSEDISAQDGWELWYKLKDRVESESIELPLFYYRQHGSSLSRDHDRLLKARAKIFKKISDNLSGDYSPSVVVVIPVKESYPDFPNVPYQDINGLSLLERAIKTSTDCPEVDMVAVASSSKDVLDFSYALEKKKLVSNHHRILRKDDPNNPLDVKLIMKLAAEEYKKNKKQYPDIIVLAGLHNIGRTSEHITKAINILTITESDSVVSVQEEREPIFKQGEDGVELLNPGKLDGLQLSKDREKIFSFNGSLIATWWEIIHSKSILGKSVATIEMSKEESEQIKSSDQLKQKN